MKETGTVTLGEGFFIKKYSQEPVVIYSCIEAFPIDLAPSRIAY